jgi:hypothetical protein
LATAILHFFTRIRVEACVEDLAVIIMTLHVVHVEALPVLFSLYWFGPSRNLRA